MRIYSHCILQWCLSETLLMDRFWGEVNKKVQDGRISVISFLLLPVLASSAFLSRIIGLFILNFYEMLMVKATSSSLCYHSWKLCEESSVWQIFYTVFYLKNINTRLYQVFFPNIVSYRNLFKRFVLFCFFGWTKKG